MDEQDHRIIPVRDVMPGKRRHLSWQQILRRHGNRRIEAASTSRRMSRRYAVNPRHARRCTQRCARRSGAVGRRSSRPNVTLQPVAHLTGAPKTDRDREQQHQTWKSGCHKRIRRRTRNSRSRGAERPVRRRKWRRRARGPRKATRRRAPPPRSNTGLGVALATDASPESVKKVQEQPRSRRPRPPST